MVAMEQFEKCTVARLGVPCGLTRPSLTRHGQNSHQHAVGFDHGLPCRVKNMARGTQ